MVVGLRIDKWDGKRGKQEQPVLTVLDLDKEHRFENTFDYVLGEGEREKPPAADALVDLAVTRIEPAFGGRLRFKGKLLTPAAGK
jgi:hypothetical protein